MKERILRGPPVLPALFGAVLVFALAGGADAGSIPGLMSAPPVGAARPTMPEAPGTITTPVTPTVPPAPTPGKSTIIIIPGASTDTVRPCGAGANPSVRPGVPSSC